jgi:phage host-nuclease inhibitor protein Gam
MSIRTGIGRRAFMSVADAEKRQREIALLANQLEALPEEERAAIARLRDHTKKRERQLKKRIARLSNPLRRYAERIRFLTGAKGNSMTLGKSGVVKWFTARPAVVITGKESEIIAALKANGHPEMIRIATVTREFVNKDAVKADPEAIRNIPGITIRERQEAFSILPANSSACIQFFSLAKAWDVIWPRKKK